MKHSSCVLVVTLLFLLPSCTPQSATVSEGEDTSQADREAITQLRQREMEAFSSADTAALATIFTSDAVLMPPNEPSVHGEDAMQAWLKNLYSQTSVSGSYGDTNLTLAGDWAFEELSFKLTMTPVGGGGATEEVGKGYHIYRRQPDGSWKIAVDVWNTDAPAPGAD